MYTIHGGKNGNYVPLGFALLPSKTENCYTRMWNLLIPKCRELKLTISPEHTHIDFELAMHNSLRAVFPSAKIDCCRFHMGQSLWRKIQSVGLSTQYKDKTTDIGKWLTMFFGLPILPSNEVGIVLSKMLCLLHQLIASVISFRTTYSKPISHQQQNSVLLFHVPS